MARDASSSRRAVVDDEDEEIEETSQAQQVARAKAEKKPKVKANKKDKRGRAEDDENLPDVDDDQAAADREDQEDIVLAKKITAIVNNFEDQPLSMDDAAARTISLQAQDWSSILDSRQLKDVFLAYNHTALLLQGENQNTDADDETVKKLDASMREIIDAEAVIKIHTTSLNTLHAKVADDDLDGNATKHYKMLLEKAEHDFDKKTTRQKYGKDERYTKFREGIWEVKHPDLPMEPLMQSIPAEEGDASDDDDDILVGGRVQGYKCPITLVTLEDPVTSTKCQHSYSKNAITSLFSHSQERQGIIRCPASGCSAMLARIDIHPDKDLDNRVKAFVRREKERERMGAEKGGGATQEHPVDDIIDDDDD